MAGEPIVVGAPVHGAAGVRWLAAHRDTVRAAVIEHGAVLVRGLAADTADAVAASATAVAGTLMPDREPFAPRTAYRHGVYSSTAWPPDQPMCAHHELSYAAGPPALLMLGCLVAPAGGGAVTLADGAAVLRDLPGRVVERFERHGWQLVRNHTDVVGVHWRTAYGAATRAGVQRYCRSTGIECEWRDGGGLRTRRRRPAVLTHPATSHRVWFNQVAFLSEWTMEPAVREYLTAEFGPDGLPFITAYGDGTPLDATTVDLINDVYAAHTVRCQLAVGDLLLVDNLRMAHGREPYHGRREVVVALADGRLSGSSASGTARPGRWAHSPGAPRRA